MRNLLLAALLLVLPCSGYALGGGRTSHSSGRSTTRKSRGTSSAKSVHVRSYTRKNGTRVRSHNRRPPRTAALSSTSPRDGRAYRRGYMAEGYSPHPSVRRDSRGRIKRSRAAKAAFEREHPCPSTGLARGPCRGYIVDHVDPLECGGADSPSNMQWQTVADAKAKDKTEGHCR
jgi:hypothetical protein